MYEYWCLSCYDYHEVYCKYAHLDPDEKMCSWPSKKNRKKWCGGHEGRTHNFQLYTADLHPRWPSRWEEWRCTKCMKKDLKILRRTAEERKALGYSTRQYSSCS